MGLGAYLLVSRFSFYLTSAKKLLYLTLDYKIFILYVNPSGTSFYLYEDRQRREKISFKYRERHLEEPIRLNAVEQ